MAGIAGIFKPGESGLVEKMLDSISYRGQYGRKIFELGNATIGMIWSVQEDEQVMEQAKSRIFSDGPGYGHSAQVLWQKKQWSLFRDELGVAPLYLGKEDDGTLMFASEAKALLPYADEVSEMLPGYTLTKNGLVQHFKLTVQKPMADESQIIAANLKSILGNAIQQHINSDTMGVWLSGGLNSSAIAALAKPHVANLHTFTAGLHNGPDLHYAKVVADHIGSIHHEVIITPESMLKILPDVIYQLETFDVMTVRAGIINLSVAFEASLHVTDVFSGEGANELLGGYDYLKFLPQDQLDNELVDLVSHLHNTSFQRVDRSASAFGTTAHNVFADSEVFGFALKIPQELKLKNNTAKWILREAMGGLLPESILTRETNSLWEGAGIGTLLSDYAATHVSDADFDREKELPNGWQLKTKEALMYYRIFRQHFGEHKNLEWVGRSESSY